MSQQYSEKEVVDFIRQGDTARARLYYFMYKVLKERGFDYRSIMTEIINQNTIDSLKDIEKTVGEINNAADYVKLFTSDHKLYADSFGQEIQKKEDEESIIILNDCPLAQAWKNMDLDLDIRKELCDMANVSDYATASLFPSVDFKIIKTCVENDCCKLIIKKVINKNCN